MARIIGEHFDSNGIRERWVDDGDRIIVDRSQDTQGALDTVAAANLDGLPTIDGLGKPLGEIPLLTLMEWAKGRGIPWEKLMYSNEFDGELRRFMREHSKLQYRALKSVHAVN